MKEEKKENSICWLKHNSLKFRIKEINKELSIIWVACNFKNLCFSLIMYDFLRRCEEELYINMDVDTTWNGHRGFKVKNSEIDIILEELMQFVMEWEIETNEKADEFSKEEWYSQ